ncbi:DUF421 domain-containing protein [Bacillus marasmi]|uniref:DUF421 domain-containing protein n=1 Tax=Bacillus marasmi TaxID=1926279 RepID=UPI0011CC1714|nr:DUF421 domain-containing protein [Bacillus marasmi]
MDFFQGQESLSSYEWILRAVIAFFFLVIVARILGQRAISQLRLLDFVMALVIGNIIAHPLSDEELGLKGSMITTAVLVLLYLGALFLMLKFPWFRGLLNAKPITIIRDGQILIKGLNKARISLDVLMEELRREKVVNMNEVAFAIWEAEGRLSVFLDPKYEPVTPNDLVLKTEPFDFPRMIIKEGKINKTELIEAHKDEVWLVAQLKTSFQTEVQNVLLATVDRKDTLKVFLYK